MKKDEDNDAVRGGSQLSVEYGDLPQPATSPSRGSGDGLISDLRWWAETMENSREPKTAWRLGLIRLLRESADALAALTQERQTLEAQVYIGEHHFPDLTWKARAGELGDALRATERRAVHAEQTVKSIAVMLGWGNVPPRETLERSLSAINARVATLIHERDEARQWLGEVVRNFGPWHDDDCPADDTCDCCAKPLHDAINAVLAAAPTEAE